MSNIKEPTEFPCIVIYHKDGELLGTTYIYQADCKALLEKFDNSDQGKLT